MQILSALFVRLTRHQPMMILADIDGLNHSYFHF
ncbi:Uncharacterised protein [Acinetobacter nosocomialis]|nr:Uncharacterised protein [Acinetobacter nosocomialis]